MNKQTIRNISKVMLCGCVAVLIAMLAIFCCASAIILYIDTAAAAGYLAVWLFFAATAFLAAFLVTIYAMGAWVVSKGKFGY